MSSFNNAPVPQEQRKITFSQAVATASYQKAIANTIRDSKQANRFIAAITSAVAVNKELQTCDPGSILSGALLGESLGLSPSPQLGQYYLVPFNNKTGRVATFILGYKGYIQLALRSNAYRKLNVLAIKAGELKRYNPLDEDIEVELIDDWDVREMSETIGYYAMFEYINGFRKSLYWSKAKMLAHADRYSAAFRKDSYERIQRGEVADSDMWKYSSYWYKDFDGMAQKTMLRQLISKWGTMSIEFQEAFDRDESMNEFSGTGDIVSVPVVDMTPAIAAPSDSQVIDVVDESQVRSDESPDRTDEKKPAKGKVDLGAL